MPKANTAKSAELQMMIWFLEAGWELFTPVADLYGIDIVVRHPETRELLAIQVKHKQPDALNEGRLTNDWVVNEPPFDYLIFFVPARMRGLVVPKERLRKAGRVFSFYKLDPTGYSRGAVRPLFSPFAFDLSTAPPETRAKDFTLFFSSVHLATTSAS